MIVPAGQILEGCHPFGHANVPRMPGLSSETQVGEEQPTCQLLVFGQATEIGPMQ